MELRNSFAPERQPPIADPYSRLRRTPTFRDAGFARWQDATVGIVGAGLVGGRLAVEAVRSGVGAVFLWDADTATPENQGNQIALPGVLKVDSIARLCHEIRPGILRGFPHDVRHAGVGRWMQCDVIVDCSDDPMLAWPLTDASNGTSTPLVRAAVDGSGQWELARVLCSHGGGGHACQLCSYAPRDIQRPLKRTPCPGQGAPDRDPTLAGGAVATAVAGVALLQVQRLASGNDLERVLDREVILDLSCHQLLELRLERSTQCLSGHRKWLPIELSGTASEMSLQDLFDLSEKSLQASVADLTAYLHPINTQAFCNCGSVQAAAGTDWTRPPLCESCGVPTSWLREMQIDRVSRCVAADLGILHTPLDDLGIPTDGAMFLAHSPGRPIQRLLLCGSQTPARVQSIVKPSVASA